MQIINKIKEKMLKKIYLVKNIKNFKKSVDKKLLFVYNISIPNKYSL